MTGGDRVIAESVRPRCAALDDEEFQGTLTVCRGDRLAVGGPIGQTRSL
jgi:hypothetical protein